MSKIRKGVDLLASDPRYLVKRLFTEAKAVVWLPRHTIQKSINGVVFDFDFTFDPSIKLMYHGIYEVDIVNTFKRYLCKGDTFIDVGANIGYLSAVAAGIVGTNGQVHSFEPVPQYFNKLQLLAAANPTYNFAINQCALGEKNSTATINVTNLSNIGWNTLVPEMMNKDTVRQSIEVPVQRLDEYIQDKRVSSIAIIKIDTEGYEFPVLKGMSSYLAHPQHRPVFMVEIAPAAYPLLGTTLLELKEYMLQFGYRAFSIHHHKEIDVTSLQETTNVLFTATDK